MISLTLMAEAPAIAESADASFAARSSLFDYDRAVGFAPTVNGTEKRGAVTIEDIAFTGAKGSNPIKAYLVRPEGNGPFAGALWVHWLGEEKSDRRQFLDEAVALAPKGVVSLLVDGMWADPAWYGSRDPDKDYENSVRQVIEIRRAMDFLLTQPKVDTARVAFVGHDFGGMYGAIAAGLDRKASAYVFIAVAPSLNDWAFFSRQPASKVEYIRKNAVLELTDYLARLQGGAVLCQFSKNDPYVATAGASVFYKAIASSGKSKKAYDAGHDMQGDAIVADRDAFLIKELELSN